MLNIYKQLFMLQFKCTARMQLRVWSGACGLHGVVIN